jgi:hypothetical protein
LNSKKEDSLRIDPATGSLIIHQQYMIQPYQPAQEFLDSELYRRYAFGRTTFHGLLLQAGNGHILLKVPEIKGHDWIFILDFKNMQLRSMVMNVVRKSLREFAAMKGNDFLLYQGILENSCGESQGFKNQGPASSRKFPWGLVKIGSYPEGLVVKLIIRYKFLEQSCANG